MLNVLNVMVRESIRLRRGGIGCFFGTHDMIGYKFFYEADRRDKALENQHLFWAHGLAPLPGDKFEIVDETGCRWFGFATELADCAAFDYIAEAWDYANKALPEHKKMKEDLCDRARRVGIDYTDPHWRNMGLLNGRLVFVDTGRESCLITKPAKREAATC